ncbi:MAG TPA: CTP synthase [Candidatus Onthovivens sp.]|nr:CTP synthase [Candidatus Onthovivens sp.]
MKFIFITGGVVSSLGKGISAACIGRLLKRRGLHIFSMKLDPYLNIDPGKMSPLQHGEVYVTKDGGETDLDLGHYERIINTNLTKESSVTSGKIYSKVLENERNNVYGGKTVQIIPHVTNEIKRRLYDGFNAKDDTDVCIVEIGGTVGDIESLPFLEAIRQLRRELGYENTFFIHSTLVPYLATSSEIKTKPTQHSVKELTGLGIQPDALLLRSSVDIDKESINKVALFCNLSEKAVIEVKDVKIIYEVALNLQKQHLDDLICNHLGIGKDIKAEMNDWIDLIAKIKSIRKRITISLVGEYIDLHDAYISLIRSLEYAGTVSEVKIDLNYLDSSKLNNENVAELLSSSDGILLAGGVDENSLEGKIVCANYARLHNVPFFAVGNGFEVALIEIARNILNKLEATSAEYNNKGSDLIFIKNEVVIGDELIELDPLSQSYALYKMDKINERHRHCYIFNKNYYKDFVSCGILLTGFNLKTKTYEIFEDKKKNFFIGVQYRPEFLSRPLNPHPLFVEFIKESKKHNEQKL